MHVTVDMSINFYHSICRIHNSIYNSNKQYPSERSTIWAKASTVRNHFFLNLKTISVETVRACGILLCQGRRMWPENFSLFFLSDSHSFCFFFSLWKSYAVSILYPAIECTSWKAYHFNQSTMRRVRTVHRTAYDIFISCSLNLHNDNQDVHGHLEGLKTISRALTSHLFSFEYSRVFHLSIKHPWRVFFLKRLNIFVCTRHWLVAARYLVAHRRRENIKWNVEVAKHANTYTDTHTSHHRRDENICKSSVKRVSCVCTKRESETR